MSKKKEIKTYIKLFRKLKKEGLHGAAGFTSTKDGSITDMEIAARYLRIKGLGISLNTGVNENAERFCEIILD